MRCEIQECGSYQPCRVFIQNILAVQLTMTAKKTQTAIFKAKLGVNQHDIVLHRQQSLGLGLKKLFPNKDIKEEHFALHYRTDFIIEENKLVVEIDEKDHDDKDLDYERRWQKELEKLGDNFIRINPDKPNFVEYEEFGRVQKYIEKSTKKSLIDDLSKRLLELEFNKSNDSLNKIELFKMRCKKKYSQQQKTWKTLNQK